jgi:tRNA dimethylallyltransferase
MVASKLSLVAIVGPTASGKTSLAIDIAKKYNGEIISADSRAIYKGLSVGTAKPSKAERQNIAHYGFDLVEPSEMFSAAGFKELATNRVAHITKRGKLPVIVGGTGLYLDAYLYDYKMPQPNLAYRTKLSQQSIGELQSIIAQRGYILPINSKNKLHLVSAIERGGVKPSKKANLPAKQLIIGLNPGREVLKSRIYERATAMFNGGVVEEYTLAVKLYGENAPGLNGGIYKVLKMHLAGQITIKEAQELFISSDLAMAKRQLTWFKRNADINWFDSIVDAKSWLADRI